MKKLLLFVIFTFTYLNAISQTTGTANLNITLSDVLSMTVTQPSELNMDFNSETKYTNGILVTAVDHISVVSNRGYVVKVIAGVPSGPSSLTASTIKLTSLIGTTNNGNTTGITFVSSQTLPTAGSTAIPVITASNASWNGSNSTNKFNIQYLVGVGGTYINKVIGSNTIPVIYDIVQP